MAGDSAVTTPDARGGSGSPEAPGGSARPGRKHRKLGRVVQGLLLAALVACVVALVPRIGGFARDAGALRHARPVFAVGAVVAEAISLGCYALLYRQVLASLGARVRLGLATRVMMASFLVSHLAPLGSAAGTLLNVSTLEKEGIEPATSADAVAVTSLVSSAALMAVFVAGFAGTAGRPLSHRYIAVVAIGLVLVVVLLVVALVVASHPAVAGRAVRRVAGLARRVRPGIDPDQAARQTERLVALTRSTLTGRSFWKCFAFAAANWLFDLLALDLMFAAFRYQPGFGPLAVAYATAQIASAIPFTPGGLGVVEVTLVAITAGFGAPRATAVVAVIGYRLVNYWLPLPFGGGAYLRIVLGHRRHRRQTGHKGGGG
ncbi:MAG: flippase-like domain-containing protein [Actinobacteria bacterium]|nr:flippase-like domain-containing protein [Actinomycetota bacterium]